MTGQWRHLSHRKVPYGFFLALLSRCCWIWRWPMKAQSVPLSVCDPVDTCVHVGWICRSVWVPVCRCCVCVCVCVCAPGVACLQAIAKKCDPLHFLMFVAWRKTSLSEAIPGKTSRKCFFFFFFLSESCTGKWQTIRWFNAGGKQLLREW